MQQRGNTTPMHSVAKDGTVSYPWQAVLTFDLGYCLMNNDLNETTIMGEFKSNTEKCSCPIPRSIRPSRAMSQWVNVSVAVLCACVLEFWSWWLLAHCAGLQVSFLPSMWRCNPRRGEGREGGKERRHCWSEGAGTWRRKTSPPSRLCWRWRNCIQIATQPRSPGTWRKHP